MIEQLPVIVAAAGQSRRYGRPKLLEKMPGEGGESLIRHVVAALTQGGAFPILVVLGPADESPYDAIIKELESTTATIVPVQPAPVEMRQSVEAGMAHLEEMIHQSQSVVPSHVLFTPADIPGIRSEYVSDLIKICGESSSSLIRGITPNGRGVHPVALAWRQRHFLKQIPPDKGLNELWSSPELSRLDWLWHAPNSHFDLDNPRDWDKFRQEI